MATSAVIACLVDVSRLGVYAGQVAAVGTRLDWPLLITAVVAAIAGAVAGKRFLAGMTMEAVQRLVAALLVLVAVGLVSGVL